MTDKARAIPAAEDALSEIRFRLLGWQQEGENPDLRCERLLLELEELAEIQADTGQLGPYWQRLGHISQRLDGIFTPAQLDTLAWRFARPDPLAGEIDGDSRTLRVPCSNAAPARARQRRREPRTVQIVAHALDARLDPECTAEATAVAFGLDGPAQVRKYRERIMRALAA